MKNKKCHPEERSDEGSNTLDSSSSRFAGLLRMTMIYFPTFLLFYSLTLMLPPVVHAESATIEQLPQMPENTVLFDNEKMFGRRLKVGGFAIKPCKYGIFYDENVFYPEAKRQEGIKPASLKIMYNKIDEKSFCGTYVILMADLSKYSTLTFMIKGQKGGEAFEIGLNDTISNKREDAVIIGSIYRYLPDGITTEWQKVIIPLEDFFGSNMSKVYSIVFHFNEVGRGAFYIDDIQFHAEHLFNLEDEIYKTGYLLLDDFDHSDLNLLGRKTNTYKKLPSVCASERVESPRAGNKGRSLKIIYNKDSTGWCGYFSLLNQIDGEYFDLSKYKNVSFMVKGEKGGETFQIGMADKNWMNIGDSLKAGQIEDFLPGGVTSEWQEVTIPLVKFGSLDLTQMGSFVIDFNKKQKGVIYLDNLKFILKTKEELLADW